MLHLFFILSNTIDIKPVDATQTQNSLHIQACAISDY